MPPRTRLNRESSESLIDSQISRLRGPQYKAGASRRASIRRTQLSRIDDHPTPNEAPVRLAPRARERMRVPSPSSASNDSYKYTSRDHSWGRPFFKPGRGTRAPAGMEQPLLPKEEKRASHSSKKTGRSRFEDEWPPPTIEFLMRDPNVTGQTPRAIPPRLLAPNRASLSSILSKTVRSAPTSPKDQSKASTFRESFVAKLIRPIKVKTSGDKPVVSCNVVDPSETSSIISDRPATITPRTPVTPRKSVASTSTATVRPPTLRKQASSDSATSWVSTSKRLTWPVPPSSDVDNAESFSSSKHCPTAHGLWHPDPTTLGPSGSSELELGSEDGDKEQAWTRSLRARMRTPVSNVMKASLKRRESTTSFVSRDARPKTMAVEFAKDLGLLSFPCTLEELDSSQREIASGGIPELLCSPLPFTRSTSAVDVSSPTLISEQLGARSSIEQLQFVHLVLSTYALSNLAEPLAPRKTAVALHAFPARTLAEGAAKLCNEVRRLRLMSLA